MSVYYYLHEAFKMMEFTHVGKYDFQSYSEFSRTVSASIPLQINRVHTTEICTFLLSLGLSFSVWCSTCICFILQKGNFSFYEEGCVK